MAEMTGAQALVGQLRSEGVDTLFALPGVQMMEAIDAVYEQGNAMRMIHTRHEQATTYMADGYARVTGDVGVAMVVPGPGALNATAGLGTAFAASSPVLLIAGQINSAALGKNRGELHEIDDQLDIFRPITKWAHRVTRVEEIPEAVHEAFWHLRTGRPRPVELEVPPDILAGTGEAEIIAREDWPRAAPPASDIERAAALLAGAERTAIIAGGGVIAADASAELVAVAERLQAPVMLTQSSKGAIPDEHPLCLAVNYYVPGPVTELLSRCDAILAVGTRLHIRDDGDLTLPPLVHIDIDPGEIGKTFATEVGIEADAREGLARLLDELKRLGGEPASRGAEVAAWRTAFMDDLRNMVPLQTGMIDTLRAGLDDDAIVVSGVTNIGYWSNVCYPVRTPRSYITSSYFGTLGFAFPTALGAKVACPERQVVALCGDGGFMYAAQELSTAMRYAINIVAVVFNNNAYGASRWDQTHRFGERFIATDLHNPDFLKFADSFGVVGLSTDPAGLGQALKEALAAEAPVLLEVEVPVMMPPFQIV